MDQTLREYVTGELDAAPMRGNVQEANRLTLSAVGRPLEIADLQVIAERHHNAGEEAGYESGRHAGVAAGRRARRELEGVLVRAILSGMLARLEGLGQQISDSSAKRSSVYRVALEGVSELRSEVAAVAASYNEATLDESLVI